MKLIKAAAAFAVMATFAAPVAAQAQTAPAQVAPAPGTLLTISAEGKVEGRPDMATINLGVTTEGQTAQAALQANAQRMTALTQALRRAGVAERDIQTSNVSVNPQQVYREGQAPRITGYQANNSVTAKIRNIDNTGRVIDAAVAAGGNTVNGVYFGYQNPDAQLDAARRNAITEARRRADLYASALNMRVVRVVAVQEGGGYSPPVPMPMARMEMAQDASTPISPGQIETTAQVSITFELR
ncbi:MAG: SIMPL domain-containing protein [Hyphomonadaceae bacterium]